MITIKNPFLSLVFLAVFLTAPALSWAQTPAPQPPPRALPGDLPPSPPPAPRPPPPFSAPPELPQQVNPLKRIAPGIFRLGDIEIDKNNKSVSLPVFVNMDRGLLEYLLVRTGGKTHESLLRTNVQPYDLQIAFLLIGFEGTDKPAGFQGAPEKPRGEHVSISLSNKKTDGKLTTFNPEECIVKMVKNKPGRLKNINWVFTGSFIANGDFQAQREGSIVAIFHDPAALIDNASEGGETDKVWYVNEGVCPPVGTPLTLTIKSVK